MDSTAAGITPRMTLVCFALKSTTREIQFVELNVNQRDRSLSVRRQDELIQLLHLLLGIGYGFGPGADAALHMFLLGHDKHQILFLFFKGEPTFLSGKPRNDDGAIG